MAQFRVASVVVDTESREIRDLEGVALPIEPRAFDVLAYLLERRDRAVPKDELLNAIWSGRVVTEGVLSQAVGKARKVFGGGTDEFIKTVHRVGFRFVADVAVVGGEKPATSAALTFVIAITPQSEEDNATLETLCADHDQKHSENRHLVLASSSLQALELALALQAKTTTASFGIHAAEVATDAFEAAAGVASALAGAALPRQLLLSAAAFELMRAAAESTKLSGLSWLAHGYYQLAGHESALNIYEVGHADIAPMAAPQDSDLARRSLTEALILGWRAAPGQAVPHRGHWHLVRCLGEGGFGEAWLAEHEKTHEHRVFKFCYRADRLRSLKREVTLFRLLNETLGERRDIARILDWNFDEAPYFVESEYTGEGDLEQWAERRGGVNQITVEERLSVVAGTARALAAAHAVGVLHKDVKPSNILIGEAGDGSPQAVLCDFGIGLITDVTPLNEHEITQLGMTEALAGNVTTSRTGTRRYMAPEILEGRMPTIQADIYSLGVVLYQLVLGDFSRVLAPGWERDIADDLLREDIAALVDGTPERRLADANLLAQRLSTLPQRRAERAREQIEAERLERERRRRRWLIPAMAVSTVFALVMGFLSFRINEEAKRANQQAQRAEAVATFLSGIFDSANPYRLKGKSLTAQDLLDVGGRELQVEAGLDPELRAHLRLTIAGAYGGLQAFDDARQMLSALDTEGSGALNDELTFERELAWASLNRQQGNLEEARTYLDVAGTLPYATSKPLARARLLEEKAAVEVLDLQPGQALPYLEETVAIRTQALPPNDTRLLRVKSELAETLNALSNHERAEALFLEVLEAYGEQQAASIETRQQYALMLLRTDELHEAWRNAHQAYTTAQTLLPADHPALADAADTLAATLMPQANFEEAEKLQQAAYQIRQAAFGDHPKTAQSVTRLANLYMNTGDEALARQYFKETFRLNEQLYGEENYMSAASLVDYALLLFDFPEAYGEAVETLEKATGMFDNTIGHEHWATGMAYLYLSRAYFLVEDMAMAEQAGDEAVAIMDTVYPDGGYRHSLAYLQRGAVWFMQQRNEEALAAYDKHFPILAEHRDTDAEDYMVAAQIYEAIKAAASTP